MTTNVVNLDALIPREDFAVEAQPPFVSRIEKISITHLEAGSFFRPALRKPDFQRETKFDASLRILSFNTKKPLACLFTNLVPAAEAFRG